jgi:hypothetical protein
MYIIKVGIYTFFSFELKFIDLNFNENENIFHYLIILRKKKNWKKITFMNSAANFVHSENEQKIRLKGDLRVYKKISK